MEGGRKGKKGKGESDFPSNCYSLLLKRPSHLIYCTEGGEGDTNEPPKGDNLLAGHARSITTLQVLCENDARLRDKNIPFFPVGNPVLLKRRRNTTRSRRNYAECFESPTSATFCELWS